MHLSQCLQTLIAVGCLHGGLSLAQPTSYSDRTCIQANVPISVVAHNGVYDIPKVNNNIDAVDFVWTAQTWSQHNETNTRYIRVLPVADTFAINVQLCTPTIPTAKSNILHIATHGGFFDKRYWDAEFPGGKYSYVDAAVAAGYSVLTYDRLGNGLSAKPNAYETVQFPVNVEILRGLTLLAKSGDLFSHLANSGKYSKTVLQASKSFKKVVHIGHSFGSFLSAALLNKYGDISDGAIFTGFIINSHFRDFPLWGFGVEHAKTNDPVRFKDNASGYLVQGTKGAVQQLFLKKGSMLDDKILDYAEKIKSPAAVGELISINSVNFASSATFDGPLQFVLAEFDTGICGGDCKGTYDINFLKGAYPQAKSPEVYIQPGAGHGLTLHKNAGAGYQATFDYLGRNGL